MHSSESDNELGRANVVRLGFSLAFSIDNSVSLKFSMRSRVSMEMIRMF